MGGIFIRKFTIMMMLLVGLVLLLGRAEDYPFPSPSPSLSSHLPPSSPRPFPLSTRPLFLPPHDHDAKSLKSKTHKKSRATQPRKKGRTSSEQIHPQVKKDCHKECNKEVKSLRRTGSLALIEYHFGKCMVKCLRSKGLFKGRT